MKYFLIILLLIIQVACFSAIYSEKTTQIPITYENIKGTDTILSGTNEENNQTLLKVSHTNNEVFIGIKCKDFNTSLLDTTPYSKENKYYEKDRVIISIAKKNFPNINNEFIIYPGGIIYDSYTNNNNWNNKYKTIPKITENSWQFIIIIDKKSLTNSLLINDDWIIKITRKSHRANIPTQSLCENQLEWTDLYFSDDAYAFKYYKDQINARLNELKSSTENLPENIKVRQENYFKEIERLSETKDRKAIKAIQPIFDRANREMIYYLGACQQANKNLPFMYSFVNCGTKYSNNKLNSYVNRTSLNINTKNGENQSFGVIVSAYDDINDLKCTYSGDLNKFVSLNYTENAGAFLDKIIPSENNTIIYSNIKSGDSRLLVGNINVPKNINPGEYKGNIILSLGDKEINLNIKFNIENIELPKNDIIIAVTDFNEDFANKVMGESKDFSKYLKAVDKICSYLVSNGIYSITLDVANSPLWFDYKENEFRKYMANGKNFDLTLKTIFLAGIKNVYIKPFDNLNNSNKGKVFAIEAVKYSKGVNKNVYMLVNDENKKSKIYKEFKDILETEIKVIDINEIKKNHYPLEENLTALRKDIWNNFFNNYKTFIPLNTNTLNEDTNPKITEYGTGADSVLYYTLNDEKIDIISSLRFKSVLDGINDLSYINIINNKIDELKKNNKGNDANEGENLMKQFKDLVLVKSPELLKVSEFESMKSKIIEFIKTK